VNVIVPVGWILSDTVSPEHVADVELVKSEHKVVTFQVPTTEPPHGVKVPHDPPDDPPQPASDATIGMATRNNSLLIEPPADQRNPA
jgi:hypothetical protein